MTVDGPAAGSGGAWRRAAAWLGLRLLEERERWALWLPVSLGLGIAWYFALPSEPPAWLVRPCLFAAGLAMILGAWHRGKAFGWAALLLAMVPLGFGGALWRTQDVHAPVVPYAGYFVFDGTVLLAEPRGTGLRLTLGELDFERLEPEETPRAVRVTVRDSAMEAFRDQVTAGARLKLKTRLSPPSGPFVPGGFDFARKAYFEGLGGVGFSLGKAELLEAPEPAARHRAVERARLSIAERVQEVVPGPSGAVAAALITGLRGKIPPEVWSDMQTAGLAHLLAISGLHMTLIAGTVFLGLRYGLSLWPDLALRRVVKRVAAAGAVVAAGGYLLLSGGTIPTQRAFLMTCIALIALMLDRNPLSMRLVAFAAGAVLWFRPEALLGASFQMSFAAVVGLVAWYERRRRKEGDFERAAAGPGKPSKERNPLALYVVGVAVTTVIASLATSPLAAYHFQRVALLGIVANLVGVPLTAFWIMPAGLAGLILMPLGLDGPAWWVMGQGVGWVLAAAHAVAGLPYAAATTPPVPHASLLLWTAGGLWLCLWRHGWRWWALAPLVAGGLVAASAERPVLLVDREARHVGWRGEDGVSRILSLERDDYLRGKWLAALGGVEKGWSYKNGVSTVDPGDAADNTLRCDAAGCLFEGHGARLGVSLHPRAAHEDCGTVEWLVVTGGGACRDPRTFVLDRRALERARGIALYASDDGRLRRRTVRSDQGDRPWAR